MSEKNTQVKDIVVVSGKDKRTLTLPSSTTNLHKIVRALYFIARNIDDRELASSLKKNAMGISEYTYTFFRASGGDVKDILFRKITFTLDEIQLSLKLLFEEGWLTDLQRNLFQRELTQFNALLGELSTNTKDKMGEESTLLSPIDLSSFFSHQEEQKEVDTERNTERDISTSSIKKHRKSETSNKITKDNSGSSKKANKIRSVRKDTLKKEERKKAILVHLRKKESCSLPEIAALFDGAGQKTIQRDLRELISQGLVEKEGERRWAKYRVVD